MEEYAFHINHCCTENRRLDDSAFKEDVMMEKSLMERFFSTYFSMKHKLSAEETEEEIRKLKERGPIESPPTKTVETRHVDSANGRMFYVNEDTSSKDTVFYIHGG